jgi:hypothetical protein
VWDCLGIYRVGAEYTDDLTNDLGAAPLVKMKAPACWEGVRSRVGIGVVDDGDAVVDDDLPAEAHADGDVAGTAG